MRGMPVLAMAESSVPIGIDRKRHHELRGRGHHVWERRVALIVVAAIPILGLIGVFGQRTTISEAGSPRASILVNAPTHVRGGIIFTSEMVITPHRTLKDARLLLGPGWFQGMTYNAVAPQPSTQTADGRWEVFDYGRLRAGTPFTVWISWQVNPTNLGSRAQDVALDDGPIRIATVRRDVTIFP